MTTTTTTTKHRIAEKRKKPPTLEEDIGTFFDRFWRMMLMVPIAIFVVGGGGLYLTRLAQCRVIPVDPARIPFVAAGSGDDVDLKFDCTAAYNVGSKLGESTMKFDTHARDVFEKSFTSTPMRTMSTNSQAHSHSPHIHKYLHNVISKVMATNGVIMTSTLSMLPGSKHGVWGELFIMALLGLTWHASLCVLYIENVVLFIVYSIAGLCDKSIWDSNVFDSHSFGALARSWMRILGLCATGSVLCFGSVILAAITTLYAIVMPLCIPYHSSTGPTDGTADDTGTSGLTRFLLNLVRAKKNYFMWSTLLALLVVISGVWGGTGVAALFTSAAILTVSGVLLHADATADVKPADVKPAAVSSGGGRGRRTLRQR